MVERYPGRKGRTEYGGGDGTPQRLPDGASIPLADIPSKVGVMARLMRTAGINDFDPARSDLVGAAVTDLELSEMSFAQREAYELDLALSERRAEERRVLNERTNGYISEPEQYIGESGEDNGVEVLK